VSQPVIFLDIDGVLNSSRWMTTMDWRRSEEPWAGHEDPGLPAFNVQVWHFMLDPECVARLKHLVQVLDANIVISSSWRHALDVPQIDECLRLRGFNRPAVGATPQLGVERGHEIRAWLRTSGHKGPFVILDDGSDMNGVEEFLVQTDFAVGLTDADVNRAIAVCRTQGGYL
jgi:HAD domain in Swiss Army Knife RNA repair proteins